MSKGRSDSSSKGGPATGGARPVSRMRAARSLVGRAGAAAKAKMKAPFRVTRSLRARDTAVVGLVVSACVVLVTWLGILDVPEQWLFDLRTKYCQWGRPAPTDQLVHVDLDESAIQVIGRWPWPRATQAELFTELALAEPKAVGIDVLYSEAEEVTITKRKVDGEDRIVEIDNDAKLEEALRALPNSIIGFSHEEMRWNKPGSHADVYEKLKQFLMLHPTATQDEAVAALGVVSPAEHAAAKSQYEAAREEAIQRLVAREMQKGKLSFAELIKAMGIKEERNDSLKVTFDPVHQIAEGAWEYELSREEVHKHRIPMSAEAAKDLFPREPKIVPLERFAAAAGHTAFVTYFKGGDGSMRFVPLVINDDGQAAPSLGLSLALAMLDVPLDEVQISRDKLVIPARDRVIEVPIRAYQFNSDTGKIGGVLSLAWFGDRGKDAWLWMYSRAGTAAERQEEQNTLNVSMGKVGQIVGNRHRIAVNNASLRTACIWMNDDAHLPGLETMAARKYDMFDPDAWIPVAEKLREALAGPIQEWKAAPPKDPGPAPEGFARKQWEQDEHEFRLYNAVNDAKTLIDANRELGSEVREWRAALKHKIQNKAVLVGWTATGRTDFVTTPLHSACPGVRLHGVVFNGIMTGNFLRFVAEWVNLAITAILALVTTLIVVRFSPVASLTMALVIAGGYVVADVTMFGYRGFVLALAAPLAAVVFCWGVGSLSRYLIDRADRARILKRFQTYVDPQLVNYMLSNPDRNVTKGERRTVTVVFTDLAGFTTLSERLGEKTVEILNEYFGLMIPIIRKHKGYLNKLLGDGMMFFFNAPVPNVNHTRHAFDAVLELQQAVVDFNHSLESRGLPTVNMRVGITRGDMIAGDAGGDRAGYSDYTVLGDTVNLASRLEGANKASGTLVIVNAEARAAGDDSFLTRPIGVLQVVGKTEGVEAFELMCRRDQATLPQVQLAKVTEQMVHAYRIGHIEECEQLAVNIEAKYGESKLTHLYIKQCHYLKENGLPAGFNGTIVLDSK